MGAQDHGSFDFETASPAGHVWNETTRKWVAPAGAKKKGLGVVGASVYTEHPEARVLTLTYRLPTVWLDAQGRVRTGGKFRWRPGEPPPQDLFDYLAAGGILEAFNVMFERLVWANICVPKYGWPPLEPHQYQLRCAMAKARVNALPGRLAALGEVLRLAIQKDANGKRLLDKFSIPRNPTKGNPALWILPDDDPEDFERLRSYCDQDVDTEDEASAHHKMREMSPDELEMWWIDQEINWRGVGVDRKGIRDCIAVLEQALTKYGDECRGITGFDPTQLAELKGWLSARGVHMASMDADNVEAQLKRMVPHPPGGLDPRRRVLEIRELIGSAAVKKLYAMELQANGADRLCNLIVHHGARTGRPTGEGPQPLNLPKAGPALVWCGLQPDMKTWDARGCRRPFKPGHAFCPWCNAPVVQGAKPKEWSAEACAFVLEIMGHRSLDVVEWFFGDAVLAISGCVRGLFVAKPGHVLIASDYSAIEAVVTAVLAKCEWRIQTFRDKKDIYLMSASKITGRTMAEYEAYKAANDANHPDRQKIGKVAELALGFMGWINAWLNFDDSGTFSEPEIKRLILDWREASPELVELAGGQSRGRPWDAEYRQEFYGFEGMAVQAIMYPDRVFEWAGIKFFMRDGALIVRLLSGRELTYHDARVTPATREYAAPWEMSIIYWTWNTNPKYGPMGWVAMSTYAGKLIENIVQATAHDILRFAIKNLRLAGYPCVLHVYDEIVCEIPEGTGSLEEFERIMATLPDWARGWPIRADGGWIGKRYRKG